MLYMFYIDKKARISYLKKDIQPEVLRRYGDTWCPYEYFLYLVNQNAWELPVNKITDIATCHAMHINGEEVGLSLSVLPRITC